MNTTNEYYALLSRHRGCDRQAFVEPCGDAITYRELFDAADALGTRLARELGDVNCGIGIYQRKSIAAVVSIFGVLAGGKAFVPIDPKLPVTRIEHILRSAHIRLVITDGDIGEQELAFFAGLDVAVWQAHRSATSVDYVAATPSVRMAAGSALAEVPLSHILFTSGTTGAPKGVMIKVESQIAFTRCMSQAFGHDESTRWLSVSPLYFDVCTLDLLVEAHCGSTVFLLPPNAPAHDIVAALQRFAITHALLISSVVKMLASRHSGIDAADLSSLRSLWYGGEACPVDALRRLKSLFPHLTFAQCYGPSEVCNNATLYRFDDIAPEATGYMPLGLPLDTVQAYVVDESGHLLTGPGSGELFLGGIQVMAGYVNDREGTAERLLPNRFDPASPHRIYRTGDFVRVDDAGLLHFHGRRDDLVKLRGNRVSLHEVQAAITSLPKVIDAIVYVGRDDIGGVLDSLNAIVVLESASTARELRRALAEMLPTYMLPDRFHLETQDGVPLKENGKLDKAHLLNKYTTHATP
jgi:amino acid adenylation domain-containing protein